MAKTSPKASIAVIILLAIALITVKGIKSCRQSKEIDATTTAAPPAWKEDNHNSRSKWRYQPLDYTQHARCRMACRNISEAEVAAILKEGTINYKKSDVNDKPCASYAVEGNTNDGQKVRIVFGACNGKTKVITCIDIGVEHECSCN